MVIKGNVVVIIEQNFGRVVIVVVVSSFVIKEKERYVHAKIKIQDLFGNVFVQIEVVLEN